MFRRSATAGTPTRVSDASMAKLTGLATLITVAKNAVSR